MYILSKSPKLQELYLRPQSINADAITALKSFKNLKKLTLYPEQDGIDSLNAQPLLKQTANLRCTTKISHE
jgi:hypothetical protein